MSLSSDLAIFESHNLLQFFLNRLMKSKFLNFMTSNCELYDDARVWQFTAQLDDLSYIYTMT